MVVFLQPTIKLFVDVSIIALQLLRESYVPLFLSTVTEVSPEQPQKAALPMEVTELGMETKVRPVQSQKTQSPIEVTELGMVTEVSPEQRKKAYSLMAVTELGMIVLLQPTINLFVDVCIIALQLSRESYVPLFLSTVTEVSPEQPQKAYLPIEVTELGMVTEVSPEQP